MESAGHDANQERSGRLRQEPEKAKAQINERTALDL